jgi:penicillin-binding protein 1A
MKTVLADKPPVDFRVPPGIKLVRVSLRTGLRAVPGEKETVNEAFKPTEEPDDEYSVIGFTNESGTFVSPDQVDPRVLGSGRGGLW